MGDDKSKTNQSSSENASSSAASTSEPTGGSYDVLLSLTKEQLVKFIVGRGKASETFLIKRQPVTKKVFGEHLATLTQKKT